MQIKTSRILILSMIGMGLTIAAADAKRAIVIQNVDVTAQKCFLQFTAQDPRKSFTCKEVPKKGKHELSCTYEGDKETRFSEVALMCPGEKPARCNKNDFTIKDGSGNYLPPGLWFEIENMYRTDNMCTFTNEDKFKPAMP